MLGTGLIRRGRRWLARVGEAALRHWKSVRGLCAATIPGLVSVFSGLSVSACQQGAAATAVVSAPPAVVAEQSLAAPTVEKSLGDFKMTFYYVVSEDEIDAGVLAKHQRRGSKQKRDLFGQAAFVDEGGNPATPDTAIAPVSLYSGKDCAPIARVSRLFAAEAELQGTGRLKDGRTINIWGKCGCPRSPCFRVTTSEWGNSGSGRPLLPFRTVAVDRRKVPLGTLLYVPELDGKRVPGKPPIGGFIHDGCLAADDTGGSIRGNEVDLFVGKRALYNSLSKRGSSHRWARSVEVLDGASRCQRGAAASRWSRVD